MQENSKLIIVILMQRWNNSRPRFQQMEMINNQLNRIKKQKKKLMSRRLNICKYRI